MARSKKKKWKSRLKKALKLAAIGGAGYLAAKRFGGKKATVADTAANEDINIGTNAPILGTDHIIKKAPVDNVASAAAGTSPHIFNTRFSKPGEEIISKRHRAEALAANAAKNKAMNYQRSQTFDARPARGGWTGNQTGYGKMFYGKKGGRVTGIAKRGFGRALMKGKR